MNPDCNEELAVAAAVVYGPCLDMVREKLLPDDFQNPELKALFQAACDLQDEGEKPNQVTIVRRCEDTGHPVGGGTLEAMHRSQVEESEIPGFCDRIADRAKDAALAKGLERCLSALKNGKSRLAVLSDLESVIMDCEKSCSGLLDSKKSTAKLAVYREKVETGSAAFIRTGFPWLDDALGGGMQGGGVYIIAARPGVGKTSLAINIGHQVSRAGTRVLFISLEMAAHQILAKHESMLTGIPTKRILFEPQLTEDEYARQADAWDYMSEHGMWINDNEDNGGPGLMTVENIRSLAKCSHCGLLIVDYLQLIDGDPNKDLYAIVTDAVKGLEKTAKDLDIPVLCLCQLNRQVSEYDEPTNRTLRDSGHIEQSAEAVIMLYRNRQDGDDLFGLTCAVTKSRYGFVGGHYDLAFYPKINLMTECLRGGYDVDG